jgi:hypothetical protein
MPSNTVTQEFFNRLSPLPDPHPSIFRSTAEDHGSSQRAIYKDIGTIMRDQAAVLVSC